jgi:hypothetical protein
MGEHAEMATHVDGGVFRSDDGVEERVTSSEEVA